MQEYRRIWQGLIAGLEEDHCIGLGQLSCQVPDLAKCLLVLQSIDQVHDLGEAQPPALVDSRDAYGMAERRLLRLTTSSRSNR
jgi:hypothetical protein